MNLLTKNHARLHIDAEIEIEAAAEEALTALPETSDTVVLSGRVTQARTGTALPKLRILALASTDSKHAVTLGSSISDSDGRFRIQFGDKPEVREQLLALRYLPDRRMHLQVETAQGQSLYTSDPIALDKANVEVTLDVPISEKPITASLWAALGEHLQHTGINHLNGVVRLLNSDGTIGDGTAGTSQFPMLIRQAMLHRMEQAFLDPTGILGKTAGEVPSLMEMHDPDLAQAYALRVQALSQNPEVASAFSDMLSRAASFASLAEVDWTIEPSLVREGDIGGALNKFHKDYAFADTAHAHLRVESNLMLYRDYLLAIWTTGASSITLNDGTHLTAAQALTQLEARFHQKFTTFDDKPRNANSILIPILVAILTSTRGKNFGFGIPAGSIPAQGTLKPRVYLDALINLSGLSATELGLRYRLDFIRPDSALSSPVQENIATLQGFFRDSFECDLDPSHVAPDILDQPIIPDQWLGNAPFFLYYDEWLRQQAPFYAENHLDLRRILPVEVGQRGRFVLGELIKGKGLGGDATKPLSSNPYVPKWQLCQDVIAVWDTLQAGHIQFYAGEYPLALVLYNSALTLAFTSMAKQIVQSLPMTPIYNQRKKLPLNNIDDVTSFMTYDNIVDQAFAYDVFPDSAENRMALRLAYYALFTIPVCIADAEFAIGNYEMAIFHYGQATRFKVGIAHENDLAGEFKYSHGDKPFTVLLNGPDAPDNAPYPLEGVRRFDSPPDVIDDYAVKFSRRIPTLAEIRFIHLRQANVMLEWADELYRENEPTSMARARELYKGVLFLHGKIPPICPAWPVRHFGGGKAGAVLFVNNTPTTYLHENENPALVSQTARAFRAIFQIDNGLNYFGEQDNIVPILRYRPLKNTADRIAAMARGAQQDFLQYTDRVELAITSKMQLTNFVQKSKLQSGIADEQKAIAEHDVVVAQDQVAAVQAAIKAKQDEIAQHGTLFGQIGDAVKGIKSIAENIPGDTKSAVGAGIESSATGKEMVGEGMFGGGAAASVMTGFGIFAVVGYVTLSGMADADAQRSADLQTLNDKALPAAQAAVEARKHGVTVTNYQKQIAQADVDLSQMLITFEQNRFLNQNFWVELAQVARRLLRRYLEMGARIAWLAERALAYEQDRELNIMRMDYFPAPLQGVTGADLMQADLAMLDATRIEGMKRTVPVRRTLSLAREFPLQYGQLKKTGRCTFRTEEALFRKAHPGTSAYRIRAISTTVQQADFSQPLRGSLINRGVSISRPQQPGEHVLVRPSESLPLSEFHLEKDMAVYDLPNETLLTFEGSSIETFWELGFPKAANPSGLDGLVDVLLTFDLFCDFAPERYESDLLALPTSERKWILISAAQYQPTGVKDLAGAGVNVNVVFDLHQIRVLPQQEKSRKIKNMAVFVVTSDESDFTAKLSSATPATSVPFTFQKGFALSNLQPDPALPPLPPAPLNAFAEMNPEQAFTLAISKPANPGVHFDRLTDIVLAIEYEASLV